MRRQELANLFKRVIPPGPDAHDRQGGTREHGVDELIPRDPLRRVVRRIIKFDRDDRRQVFVTNKKINVLAVDGVEFLPEVTARSLNTHEIGESHLRENRVVGAQPAKDFVEGPFGGREEVISARELWRICAPDFARASKGDRGASGCTRARHPPRESDCSNDAREDDESDGGKRFHGLFCSS